MTTPKIIVPYEHDPHDLSAVHLAVTTNHRPPADDAWRPALRDLVDGRRVVWIRHPAAGQPGGHIVWLRDAAGTRRVQPMRPGRRP